MTTYPATNLQLTYDNATNQWNFTEVAYDYGATPPPSWSGYTGEDPAFEYATENGNGDGDGDGDTDKDPCPPGYIYDETLKQCIIDPNYKAPAYAGEPTGGGKPDQPGLHIPSNETKENWIANADTVITSGEGAGKTGLQNYLDNLNDRGFTKVVDGKLIFKKDVGVHPLAEGMANILGHGAKTDKIIQDLQRMGAINAQVTSPGIDTQLSKLTGRDELGIDFAPEMELSNAAFTFPTYNYKAGTEVTDFTPGDYTGFTTPKGQTFETWEQYIRYITQNLSADTTTGFQRRTETVVPEKDIAVSTSDYRTFEDQEAELEQEREQELHNERLRQEQIKTERAQFDLEKTEREDSSTETAAQQERIRQRQVEKEVGTGGSFGREDTRPVIPPSESKKTGQGGAPIWRL